MLLAAQAAAVPAALPTISALDVSTLEGGPGESNHAVSVPFDLSAPSADPVTVSWATADGTAHAASEDDGVDDDYFAASGEVTFAPGATSASVQIVIDGGLAVEPDETFTVVLSSPVNATIERGVATVTILNDDLPSIPDAGEVNVIPAGGGGQCVAVEGSGGCKLLEAGVQVPIDEVLYINPGSSKVTVQSTAGIGSFYGGRFDVNEIEGAKPILVMRLVGGNVKQKCAAGNRTVASADGESKVKPIRRLWGKGKGRFRTRGRYSSGTVRGTNWVTTDYCDGTDTRVVSGIVRVYDLVLKKGLLLKAGQSYFAKAGKIN